MELRMKHAIYTRCCMCGTEKYPKYLERVVLGKRDKIYLSVCFPCFGKLLKMIKYQDNGTNVIFEEDDK